MEISAKRLNKLTKLSAQGAMNVLAAGLPEFSKIAISDMKEEIELNIDLSGNGNQAADKSTVDFSLGNDGSNQSDEIKLDFSAEPVKN